MRISPTALELGAVAVGATRTAELSVTNVARFPVRIEEVTTGSPAVSTPSFEAFELASGETRVIHVAVTPTSAGTVRAEVAVSHDDSSGRSVALVQAEGVEATALVDARELDFGRVQLGATERRALIVTNPSSLDVVARATIERGEAFSVAPVSSEGVQIPAHGTGALEVEFTPQELGAMEGALVLSPCEGCVAVTVALRGEAFVEQVDIFPSTLDFGRVSVGGSAVQTVSIQNLGTDAIRLTGATVLDAPDGVFTVELGSAAGGELAPRQIRQFSVRFQPKAEGPVGGPRGGPRLQVELATATGTLQPKLLLLGEGGEACLVALPGAVDFGEVAEQMTALRRVEVMNRCPHELTITDAAAHAEVGGFFAVVQSHDGQELASGAKLPIDVAFSPKLGSTGSGGVLAVTAVRGATVASVQVPLTGRSRKYAPCVWSVTPGQLDFGTVAVGTRTSLGVTLSNTGTDSCFVGGGQLVAGSDAEFSVEWLPSMVLAAGQSVTWKVAFAPTQPGSFSAQLETWISHPTQARQTAFISGEAVQSCFKLEPAHHAFGLTRTGCAPQKRRFTAKNACSGTVTVSSAALDATSSAAFEVTQSPALPFPLASGNSLFFDVAYEPSQDAEDSGALRVTAGGVTYTATMDGTARAAPVEHERFTQVVSPKVDVLFVIDNSASMQEEQRKLGEHFAAFLSAAKQHGADYQIGVTTTGISQATSWSTPCPGGAAGAEAGRLFPVDGTTPRIITPATANADAVFAHNVNVGTCHWVEQGLEAAYLALSDPLASSADVPGTSHLNDGNAGFLRRDAKLAIVFVSDEEDFSSRPVAFYESFFRSLKGNDASRLAVSAIVGPPTPGACPTASSVGARYLALAQALGGVTENICTPDWTETMENIGRGAFEPRRTFRLRDVPTDASQVTVELDGVPVTTGWTYDATTNSVVFDESSVPGPGVIVDVRYPVGC